MSSNFGNVHLGINRLRFSETLTDYSTKENEADLTLRICVRCARSTLQDMGQGNNYRKIY